MSKDFRINREITAGSVRMIDADGNQLGILALADALIEASKAGLDLVEVSPNSSPPVCRVMDYGKYRYQQSKKKTVAKKSQTTVQVKEIRLRPKTEDHDKKIKLKHIKRFLDQNNKVKITMMFRGREIIYADQGMKIMEDIKNELEGSCIVDREPKLEGRNMIMIVSPKK
ncbi:MAG TPA: translation initiation factor IF-3 [Deltaproteobacteria bacterium]|nr:translation initiation factor IF-3 [Deltaproteobacteria bacterium]